MPELRRVISGVVYALVLLLCAIPAIARGQEAPRDSGSLIKPPTIKPPTARSQASGGRGGVSARKKARRVRRSRVRRRASSARAAAKTNAAIKPREVQGVIVDTEGSMPVNVPPSSSTAAAMPKPRRRVSFGVLNGKAISLPTPIYPSIAKAARATGTVVVRVVIDEEGRVTEAEAISGHPLLRKAAEQAAWGAKFSPTMLSGQPVKVTGVLTYDFVE